MRAYLWPKTERLPAVTTRRLKESFHSFRKEPGSVWKGKVSRLSRRFREREAQLINLSAAFQQRYLLKPFCCWLRLPPPPPAFRPSQLRTTTVTPLSGNRALRAAPQPRAETRLPGPARPSPQQHPAPTAAPPAAGGAPCRLQPARQRCAPSSAPAALRRSHLHPPSTPPTSCRLCRTVPSPRLSRRRRSRSAAR